MVQLEYPQVTVSSNPLILTYDPAGDHTYGGFDRFGRIVDQKWQIKTAGTVKDQFQYAYDRTSNRLYADNTQTTLKDWKYEYDNLDRLSDARRGTLNATPSNGLDATGYRQNWTTLEALGNWRQFKQDDDGDGSGWDLDQARSHNKVNEIDTNDVHSDGPGASITASTGTNWIDPKFDASGNMTQGPKPGDEGTATQCQFYTYDAWNRLVEVWRDANGDGDQDAEGTDEQLAEHRYDGLNRRIVKIDKRGGGADVTYDYYYNTAWQVLEVRKDSDSDPYEQYVWDARYIDAPVVRFRDGNTDGDYTGGTGEGDDTLYYCNDANMNVTAMVNTSGTVVERYMYDPYGKVTVLDPDWSADDNNISDYGNEILYCGYRHDAETRLYQVRNRMHHPTLGRWITRDPIGYGSVSSLYHYTGSEPIGYVDPLGLDECKKGQAQIVIIEAGNIRAIDIKLTTFNDIDLGIAWTDLTDFKKLFKDWLKGKIKSKILDLIGVPKEFLKQLKLIKLLNTGNLALHFRLRFKLDITFDLRQCECKCRRLWIFWCTKWVWGKAQRKTDTFDSGWMGDHDNETFFKVIPSDIETTVSEALNAVRRQYQKVKRRLRWEPFIDDLKKKYNAEIVDNF